MRPVRKSTAARLLRQCSTPSRLHFQYQLSDRTSLSISPLIAVPACYTANAISHSVKFIFKNIYARVRWIEIKVAGAAVQGISAR